MSATLVDDARGGVVGLLAASILRLILSSYASAAEVLDIDWGGMDADKLFGRFLLELILERCSMFTIKSLFFGCTLLTFIIKSGGYSQQFLLLSKCQLGNAEDES